MTPPQRNCKDCGIAIPMWSIFACVPGGVVCSNCSANRYLSQPAAPPPIFNYQPTYPGAHFHDPIFGEKPKVDNSTAKWKEHFEGLGMPWNFYQALLTAAQSLRNGSLDSAAIDKDGYLVLKYATHWVKLKISEITVEPPG